MNKEELTLIKHRKKFYTLATKIYSKNEYSNIELLRLKQKLIYYYNKGKFKDTKENLLIELGLIKTDAEKFAELINKIYIEKCYNNREERLNLYCKARYYYNKLDISKNLTFQEYLIKNNYKKQKGE